MRTPERRSRSTNRVPRHAAGVSMPPGDRMLSAAKQSALSASMPAVALQPGSRSSLSSATARRAPFAPESEPAPAESGAPPP